MCRWCDKDKIIKDLIEYDNTLPRDRYNCIVYADNSYHLWVECDDWYYSGLKFFDIEFCPYCGRKLK